MSHILDSGGVLPSGLLGNDHQAMMGGFNKSYKNFPMRVGVVVATYSVNDEKNRSKLAPEYDVLVVEQFEDKGATTTLYRNCLSSEGLGSVADFFERTLRPKKKKTRKGDAESLKGQDGAIVLLLCLDGMSEKGIVIGQLTHPDRKTTLKDEGPRLEGEFNGVNIKVEKDGSTSLTFKGATDSYGDVVDKNQTPTTMKVEKDGSYQVGHDTVTFRLDKKGTMTVTAKDSVTINCKDATITASGNATVNCKDALLNASGSATVEGATVKLGKGASEAVLKGETFKKLFDAHIHPTAVGASGPPASPLAPTALSKKVKTE